jgi:PIN domain nuclease of toxin-antitoxin system
MISFILDASAILAYLNRESGFAEIARLLDEAGASAVNIAEVVSKLDERGFSLERTREAVESLGIDIVPCDEMLAYQIGHLRTLTRNQGLSLGDRACLATALLYGVPAITADRHWKHLKLGVRIQVIR